MSTAQAFIYAIFLCTPTLPCVFSDGPFATKAACEKHLDVLDIHREYNMRCLRRSIPVWENAER